MIGTTRRALLAVSAAVALPATRLCAQTVATELKVSHYLPPNHTIHKALEAWGEDLDKRSGGRLKLRIYPAGQLGPVQRQFDLARNGQADMAVGLTGATPGRYPMTELSNLPFVFPGADPSSAVTSKRLTELAPQYLAHEFEGLRIFWFGVTPAVGFFTGRREVDGPADLKGLKIRFQGEQHAKMLRTLGAVPLQIPPGDVADGMAKGVIDGAMYNYEAAGSFGLGTVTHHVAEPAFVTATLGLVMNTARYAALPADLRAMLDDTTGPAAAARLGHDWDGADRHGRDYMVAQKVAIHTIAPAELAKLKTMLEPLGAEAVDSLEKSGKPARAFLAAYQK